MLQAAKQLVINHKEPPTRYLIYDYMFVLFQARQAQEPITSAGKALIDGGCNMLQAAKQLAINPKDPPTYQMYSNHSKSVSDAIKRLVSAIRYVKSTG